MAGQEARHGLVKTSRRQIIVTGPTGQPDSHDRCEPKLKANQPELGELRMLNQRMSQLREGWIQLADQLEGYLAERLGA